MKIHRDDDKDRLRITGYGDGYIETGDVTHRQGVSLVDQTSIPHTAPKDASSLSFADLEHLLEPRPEVILLGTGPTLTFPDMSIVRRFQGMGIGCEVMDSGAACRTYNILNSEGRTVAAWLQLP